jgi:hypothetical protein
MIFKKNNFIFAFVFFFLNNTISGLPPQEDTRQVPIVKDTDLQKNDVQQLNNAIKRHIRRVTPYVFANLFTTQNEPLPTNQLNVIVVSHIMPVVPDNPNSPTRPETFREFLDGLDEQYQSSGMFLKDIVEDFENPVDIYTSPLISADDVDTLNIPNVNDVYEDSRLFEKNVKESFDDEKVLGVNPEALHRFLEEKAQNILNVQSFHQSIMLEWAERNYDEMNVIILASPLWSLLWQTIACKKPISNIDLHHLSQLGSSQQHENRISIKLFQKKKGSSAFQYE